MHEKLSIYGVAHQDDWQLFMEPNISHDLINEKCKTVLIHTTAGDAGNGQKFWEAREAAAINSLLFRIIDGKESAVEGEFIAIMNKKIRVVQLKNCSIYFLRLPDGNMNGGGFKSYSHHSLSNLRQKEIDKIVSVDKINEYHSFQELVQLIDHILERECNKSKIYEPSKISLNFPEYDQSINPGDHNDHLQTALLFKHTALYELVNKYAYVHYDIYKSGETLIEEDLFWKVGMFCIYHQTVLEKAGYSTIHESPLYKIWCTKNSVYREVSD